MITGPLQLLFGEDDMKIISIHIEVLIYTVAVKKKCKIQNLWHQLEQNYSYPCMCCTCLLFLQINV
jgi:hypothetical protein